MSWDCTCRFCLKHPGGEAGPTEAHGIESQNPEGVVDVGRQLEVSSRLGSRDLGEVVPVTSVVQRVVILDQKLCVKQRKTSTVNWTLHTRSDKILDKLECPPSRFVFLKMSEYAAPSCALTWWRDVFEQDDNTDRQWRSDMLCTRLFQEYLGSLF